MKERRNNNQKAMKRGRGKYSIGDPPADRPSALTIAGSDSGGGAGIQADLKVFALAGVYGASVITGVTAQNTVGVHAVHAIPLGVIRSQLDAVLSDIPIGVVKTGMLWARSTVRLVADRLATLGKPVVVDPVMLAGGGERLLTDEAIDDVRGRLLPVATIVTPNLGEAALLLGSRVTTTRDMRRAARELVAMGAQAALVKGGHLSRRRDGTLVDVLAMNGELVELAHPHRKTPHTHGTGCVLSATIATRLALGDDPGVAVERGIAAIAAILENARPLGQGSGPADPLLTRSRSDRS